MSDKEPTPFITNGDPSDDHVNCISVEPEEDISHPNGVQDLTAPNEPPASPTESVTESNGQTAEDTSELLKSNNDENPKQTKDSSISDPIIEETLVETDQQCPSQVPSTNDPDKAAKDEETTTHLSESSAASNPMVVEEDEFSNDSEFINTATIQPDDNPQDSTAAGEAGKDKNNSHENREDSATVTTPQSDVASETAGKEIRVNSNEILEKLNSGTISDDDIDHDSPKELTAQQIADETEDVMIPIHDGRDSPTVPDWGSARTDGLKVVWLVYNARNRLVFIGLVVATSGRDVKFMVVQSSAELSILSMSYLLSLFSIFFRYGKKLPYVVTRDVCPSVCLSVCRLWKYLWNAVAL